jgi:hypothetical protein
MFEAAALSHVSSMFQHVVQSKRAVECAQAIVFIRHESRYLIVPDSKVHHGVSEGCKDAEGSLTAWVRECSLNFELVSPWSGRMAQALKQRRLGSISSVHLAQDEVNQHRRLVEPPQPGATTYLFMRGGVERNKERLTQRIGSCTQVEVMHKASTFEV